MSLPRSVILDALRLPSSTGELSARAWEQLLYVSRRHGLAGRWYAALATADRLGGLPAGVADQLYADHLVAERRRQLLAWEIHCVARALAPLDLPVVLLKGGAYAHLGLPPGTARMSADLDILVPEASLDLVEQACREHGWRDTGHDEYDQRYYREWMHELPPLQHAGRGTVLDVHFNILPRYSRLRPDAAALIADSVDAGDGLRVLAPADMVIHSIVHGFQDGEFLNGLRDVLDVYELLQHFSQREATFWSAFATRAQALGCAAPALLALDATARYFALAVPADVRRALERDAGTLPMRGVFVRALDRVLVPTSPPRQADLAAARFLKARAHWQRMPPALLIPHLSRKLWQRLRADDDAGEQA